VPRDRADDSGGIDSTDPAIAGVGEDEASIGSRNDAGGRRIPIISEGAGFEVQEGLAGRSAVAAKSWFAAARDNRHADARGPAHDAVLADWGRIFLERAGKGLDCGALHRKDAAVGGGRNSGATKARDRRSPPVRREPPSARLDDPDDAAVRQHRDIARERAAPQPAPLGQREHPVAAMSSSYPGQHQRYDQETYGGDAPNTGRSHGSRFQSAVPRNGARAVAATCEKGTNESDRWADGQLSCIGTCRHRRLD
jgi:hypothetical protein